MARSSGFRIINAAMALVFLLSAALQYNDPDPWRWALLYLGAALACLFHGRMSRTWILPAVVGAAALVWTAVLAPEALPGFRVADLARTMKAQSPEIELSRELLGLLIIVTWMAVLVSKSRRTKKR